MQILDGKALAMKMRENIKEEVKKIEQSGEKPGLAVILVGDNPASKIYVSSKQKACEDVGFYSEAYIKDSNTTEEELISLINELNKNDKIHGILVQLPLPENINKQKVIETISPAKDVDGFTFYNTGAMMLNQDSLYPCTPYGIIKLLEEYNIDIAGKNAVVVGRSDIVGKPIANMLLNKSATVSICHSKTKNLADFTKNADILVAAIGKPKFITEEMVKENAVVIDVGINRIADKKIVGDVDFDSVCQKCRFITPVPGGVGPMTIACLLYNTLKAYKKIHEIL